MNKPLASEEFVFELPLYNIHKADEDFLGDECSYIFYFLNSNYFFLIELPPNGASQRKPVAELSLAP